MTIPTIPIHRHTNGQLKNQTILFKKPLVNENCLGFPKLDLSSLASDLTPMGQPRFWDSGKLSIQCPYTSEPKCFLAVLLSSQALIPWRLPPCCMSCAAKACSSSISGLGKGSSWLEKNYPSGLEQGCRVPTIKRQLPLRTPQLAGGIERCQVKGIPNPKDHMGPPPCHKAIENFMDKAEISSTSL